MDIDWDKTSLKKHLLMENWGEGFLYALAGFDPKKGDPVEDWINEGSQVPQHIDEVTYLYAWEILRQKLAKDAVSKGEIAFENELEFEHIDWNYVTTMLGDHLKEAQKNYQFYKEVWEASNFYEAAERGRQISGYETQYSPITFIDHFYVHKPPIWIDWATDNGIYTPTNPKSSNIDVKEDFFHPDRKPPELEICIDVYNEFKNSPDTKFEYKNPREIIKAYVDKEYSHLPPETRKRIVTVVNWKKGNPKPKKIPNKEPK